LKKFIKSMVFTVAASTALMAATVSAEQKIGIVDIQGVMQQLPQTAKMVEALQAEFKDAGDAIKKLEDDIKYNQEKKARDSALMTQQEISALDSKLAGLIATYREQGQALQQKSQARQNEESTKVLALVKQAIDNIASKEDFDMVVRSETVVFALPKYDISKQVVEQVSKLK